MKQMIAFMLTAACALSGAKYQSGLHEGVQAAFFEEAQRAYRDIIAYDENAPVTQAEIYRLYRRDFCLSPVRQAVSGFLEVISEARRVSPEEYAGKCIYEGRILANAPEGVIFVRAYLLPFSPEEAKKYDEIQKSGDEQALDWLFSPLEDRARACMGAYTPENGFEMYFQMKNEDGIIPCAEGVLFLTQEALSGAMRVSQTCRFSPPVRDARGVLVFEFVSG